MRLVRFLALAFVVVLAACGSSGSKTNTTATTTGSSATTAAAAGVTINSAQTALGSVLVNSEGRTLYHFAKDTATASNCNAGCSSTWPPVTVPSGQQPKAGTGVTGTFTVIMRADGTQQAVFNGQPLYIYSGDSKAGDTNGEGIGGVWHVVKASGAAAGAAPAATTPTTAATTKTTAGGMGGGY